MICPKYDSCCVFINASNGLVALMSSITDLLVRLAVHGIRSSLLQHHTSTLSILLLSAFLIVQDSQPYSTTGKTNAFTILNFVVIVIYLYFHILFSPVIAALPNANRFKSSPLQEPESSILAPRKIKSHTTPTFTPSTSNSSISSVDMTLFFFSGLGTVRPGHSSLLHLLPAVEVILYFLLIGWCHQHISNCLFFFLQFSLLCLVPLGLLLPHDVLTVQIE